MKILLLAAALLVLLCPGLMAASYSIQLDFASGSQGYAGTDWNWSSTEGVPAGSMRKLGNFGDSPLMKSPMDTITIPTPGIMSVSASLQAMSSNGMGAIAMNYRLTYSDGSTEQRQLGIWGIGGWGNEWKPATETFDTARPLASIELLSIMGIAPNYEPTYVYIDAVSITATGGAPVTEPAYGISNRAAYDPIISTALASTSFRVWGLVTTRGIDAFDLDDGSGMVVRVAAPGFSGIGDGDYASAKGKFSGEGPDRVLNAQATDVVKLQ